MSYKKKTALEKLHESHGLPKVEKITGKMSKKWGRERWQFRLRWK